MTDTAPEAGSPTSGPTSGPLAPAQVDTARIVVAGTAIWAVALVVTLVVPALRTGERSWWPWTCATGVLLGLAGLAYVTRGRGNAAGARRSPTRSPHT